MTRTIHIPAVLLTGGSTGNTPADPGRLAMLAGSDDELPQGPTGFDVDDGGFLITDPLRKRIALYDSQGKYRSEWQLGFSADSITLEPDRSARVRDALTGEFHQYDRKGSPVSGGRATRELPPARLTGRTTGVVERTAASGEPSSPLEIAIENAGLKLLSLENMGTDAQGDTYVALEIATGAETVGLNKSVRRFAPDGKVIRQTTDLPLDYYIAPVNELRIRKSVVYQLMTTPSEVRINVWDMK
jgi:hypothetical protein